MAPSLSDIFEEARLSARAIAVSRAAVSGAGHGIVRNADLHIAPAVVTEVVPLEHIGSGRADQQPHAG